MNRIEYKAEHRKWRIVLKHISIPKYARMGGLAYEEAWMTVYKNIHKKMPSELQYSLLERPNRSKWRRHWGIESSSAMVCNYTYLPNSFPHATRNP